MPLCLGIITPGTLHALVLTKITGFKLQTCLQNNCFQLLADSAESGQFTQLQTLKNYKATFVLNNKTENIEGDFGYVDFATNTVVLKTKNQREISINLNNLNREEF